MIDQKLLKRTLENRFVLKHTSQSEIEKISQINFVLFLFWLDKDNITIENGYYRYSKNTKITIYKEMGHNHYTGMNYPPIYFLECFMELSFRQSLYLLKHFYYKISKQAIEKEFKTIFDTRNSTISEQPKIDLQYILNENLFNASNELKTTAYKRAYGYLTSRGIERFVIQNIINHKWLMMDNNYNLCFITYEDVKSKDTVIAITKKGTYSTKEYKCNYTKDRHTGFLYLPEATDKPTNLFVFESCLDLFSFVQLVWLKKIQVPADIVCISLNGANNRNYVYKVINQFPTIKNTFLCLDNDFSGIKSTEIFEKMLITKTYDLRPILKELTIKNKYTIKDWNEALSLTNEININLNSYLE